MTNATAFSLTSSLCNAATTIYDFNVDESGWTNVQTSTTGPTQFEQGTGFGITNALGPTPLASRDDPGTAALWARSPIFLMPVDPVNSISFQLFAGNLGGASAPINDAAASLTSPTVSNAGFQGLLLRRVSDGAFLLSAGRSSNGTTAEAFTWDAATINGVIGGDAPGETYTLDLVDEGHGGWGWVALDNVSVTTTVPEPSTFLLTFIGLGVIARRRRR